MAAFDFADPRVRHHRSLPARDGTPGTWPEWLPAPVLEAWQRHGIETPWQHQTRIAEAAHAGWHTVAATGTASGKTLGYLLPVLAATYGGPEATGPLGSGTLRDHVVQPTRPHTALYLAPTKALAHDQLHTCENLGLPDWRVAAIDGDSEPAERDWARKHAAYVLTNPDLLHHSILPNHQRWAGFLRTLRYIVIDECHRYRGMFGAHVAMVIRRLRRLCAGYGAEPVVLCSSATVLAPDEVVGRLIGAESDEIVAITEDAAPRAARDIVLWQPTGHHDDETADLLADQVNAGRQAIAFVASRTMAEVVAVRARRECAHTVESYRGGYLARDRRIIEAGLKSGEIRGVATTNALELGVDIAGMDAVLISGYPGTRAALWQQAGRAGRSGRRALVVLVARNDPLDAYLLDHPEVLLDEPVEAAVLFPDNRYVLGPHLAAAAHEMPLGDEDDIWFGPTMVEVTDELVTQGVLRRRPQGWFWTLPQRPHDAVDIRSVGGRAVEVIEADTGRVLGHVDPAMAHRSVHPGAVHLHQGETWVVDELDPQNATALVHREDVRFYTQPVSTARIDVITTERTRAAGRGKVHLGEVDLIGQVTGYLRRDERTGKVWDQTPLELPSTTLRTRAVWWTVPAPLLREAGLTRKVLAGAAHAAEHTAIGLLPLFAPCDRWDVGGVSTALHPDTGELTIFVHDGHPGGSGFAELGWQRAEQWWRATHHRLVHCPCTDGCPGCVVSPKCGSGNQPLDKAAAAALMGVLLEVAGTTGGHGGERSSRPA